MGKNEKLIVDAAVLREGKKILSCARAIKLSQKNNISLKKIGDTCNRLGIKIVSCQLGCFE
jgi:predicted peroxiredoxin